MFSLRMRHNAMSKNEYELKKKKLQDKWKVIQNMQIEEMPDDEDIE
jgi:hypothetical protein